MITDKGIQVQIIADSINPVGKRLTSFLWKYPRFIHSEVMTHRTFSRNAASSRAIPVEKIINSIKEDTAMPIYWGKAQSGMQSSKQLEGEDLEYCKQEWINSRDDAIKRTTNMMNRKLHKQIANRILEPWMHMVTFVSATDWGNFFNLRVHKDAQPEIQELSRQVLLAYKSNQPKELKEGEWHLPFNDQDIDNNISLETRLKIVTARAARTSYKNFSGKIDIAADCELHDRLSASGHWSPFEHAAQCLGNKERSGNFVGWKQYRKTFSNENQEAYDPDYLLERLIHI